MIIFRYLLMIVGSILIGWASLPLGDRPKIYQLLGILGSIMLAIGFILLFNIGWLNLIWGFIMFSLIGGATNALLRSK